MYWANFLHIYQPPTQTEEIVRKVARESYQTIIRTLEEAPNGKITLNINAVLTEQLDRYDLGDIIAGIKALAERGQIEFTGSAIYHPILPLIPKEEAVRQINLNTEINRRFFGDSYRPRGFFPPEMCYSLDVAKIVAEMGFKWIIVDEIAFAGAIGQARDDVLYTINGLSDFAVFFKERPFSSGITYGRYPTARPFLEALKSKRPRNAYLLTGTDGEIYGHHRPGQEKLLQEIFASGEPGTCTVSDLLTLFKDGEKVSPLPSSWSTWPDEMAGNVPFPQWNYPGHALHRLQWQLTHLALETVDSVPRDTPGFEKARHLLDEGLHSDQFWWASCRPWWDTGMIESGAKKLLDAILQVQHSLPSAEVERAFNLFNSISSVARQWQETGEARRRRDKYLEEHKEVTSELTFGDRQAP